MVMSLSTLKLVVQYELLYNCRRVWHGESAHRKNPLYVARLGRLVRRTGGDTDDRDMGRRCPGMTSDRTDAHPPLMSARCCRPIEGTDALPESFLPRAVGAALLAAACFAPKRTKEACND